MTFQMAISFCNWSSDSLQCLDFSVSADDERGLYCWQSWPRTWSPSKQDGSDLRFLSPESDASLHCRITDTWLVYGAVCLFTSQLSLVLTAHTHEEMARLSWRGWLATYRDGAPVEFPGEDWDTDGFSVCRQSSVQDSQVLSGPGVD